MRKMLRKVLPQKIYDILKDAAKGNYSYFFWLFPIKRNKIVISSFHGKGYGDNGKYIVEEILRQKLQYDIVWLLKKELVGKVEIPSTIRIVEYGSLKSLYELATAKVWIDNCRKSFYPPKRKTQYYIQTWHSPLRLKKIEKDAENNLSKSYLRMAKKDAKNCDLMIAGSDFSWNIYRNSFWYEGEILKCGTPRCDLFFQENPSYKKKVYESFGILPDKKLIIFAPTFRNKSTVAPYLLDYTEVIRAVQEKFSGEWKFLIRLHPSISHLSLPIKYDDTIINATNYEDMQELLYAADILITDYSSCMFDMAIAQKICFIHAPDVEVYLDKERQLYFDFKELPFSFSKTNEQLVNNILNFDPELYKRNLKRFMEKIKLYETGTASQQVVKRIKEVINK